MNKFKHSGAFGDLIYSLPIVKHFGGGEFYLHLNQMNWIGKFFYGVTPVPYHQGRMTEQDFQVLSPLLEAQPYITKVSILNNHSEITHNLDRFRVPFAKNPGNYIDVYADVFNISDPEKRRELRQTPWLTVPKIEHDYSIVINRTARWIPSTLPEQWNIWKSQGMEKDAVFVGLPEEHQAFQEQLGWSIPYLETKNLLEVAQIIDAAEVFIGNQSQALSLAIGLGKTYYCEARRDLTQERNECYFPNQPGGYYF